MIEELYQIYLQHPQICTDTRSITAGCLFFCLKGDVFDGNTFARQALEAGAYCVVTEDVSLKEEKGFYVVKDALLTLQELAAYHRSQLTIPVLGITGTNGKTTTKELVTCVLQTKYKVSFTKGNFNNHIGVPLTLLSIPKDTEVAVVEMGANHVGEIADLCNISRPTFGVVTNIGTAHIEGFGSRENIILTKRALYDAVMAQKGVVFVNGGDETLVDCVGDYPDQVRYGHCEGSVCMGTIVDMTPYLSVCVKDSTFTTHLTGEYNLSNIECALAVGGYFGVEMEKAMTAISGYIPTNNRSQVVQSGSNVLIADYYNANPSSMMAALRNLCKLKHAHKVAVLGDMLELGTVSRDEHLKIVNFCKENGIEGIFVGHQFQSLGLPSMVALENVEELNQYLKGHPIADSMVLVKGSRGIHLEKIVL